MPIRVVRVDLSVAGETEIVQQGQRINGLTISVLPAVGQNFPADVQLKLGNNQPIGIYSRGAFPTFDQFEEQDVNQGVTIINNVALPAGSQLIGFVSFTSRSPLKQFGTAQRD